MDDPHPLDIWVEKQGTTLPKFAAEHRLVTTSIYSLVNGWFQPRIEILMAVEVATGGDVTLNQMVEWWSRQPKKSKAAKKGATS